MILYGSYMDRVSQTCLPKLVKSCEWDVTNECIEYRRLAVDVVLVGFKALKPTSLRSAMRQPQTTTTLIHPHVRVSVLPRPAHPRAVLSNQRLVYQARSH